MAYKIIKYKGQEARIDINSTTCRGTGETTHEVCVVGLNNNFRFETSFKELNEDILMSFDGRFHKWVDNPNPRTKLQQLLEDTGYTI